ncbi:MAG: hypothetical protein ACYS5V_06835, partial [Planctomycetota bacterium]
MSSRRTVAMAAFLAVTMAAATGCVPKDQYDSAVAAARRANDELGKSQSALQSLRVENGEVRKQLGARDAALATKDELIQKLTDGNDVL